MIALLGDDGKNGNLDKLLHMQNAFGNIDTFYGKLIEQDSPNCHCVLVNTLASGNSCYKLKEMGFALVCEYLRNVGYDLAKPDRHILEALKELGFEFSSNSASALEAIMIVSEIAMHLKKPAAEVDHILWSYRAYNNNDKKTISQLCESSNN